MSTVTIQGIYRDRLIDSDHRTVLDTGWRHNLIVLPCRVLLAGFLRNDTAPLGVQAMQVGRGSPTWDVTPPPAADPNTTDKLVDPLFVPIPLAKLTLEYLDDADNVVAGPTHRIQVTATLGQNEPTPAGSPPFPLREFGLFGSLKGKLQMIDYIRHPLIEKDGAVSLERKVRLIL
jgi:hypothetical protein